MAFDAKTTASLYETLAPVRGGGQRKICLVPQLAALIEDRFVTKDFLRAELVKLRLAAAPTGR